MCSFAAYENVVNETVEKLRKSSEDSINAYKNAVQAVKNHTKKLYEALDLSEVLLCWFWVYKFFKLFEVYIDYCSSLFIT